MAAELAMAGINLDFAPVLDIDSNPQNPVIGDRSFSSCADEVIRFGREFIGGLRDGGVIACGKHFPGHGDTGADSHFELPRVDKPLSELMKLELRPFIQACRERISCIMTAHVLYPAVDAEFPATLSRRIVTGLLRRWHRGIVVFSDDMEMKAIRGPYPPGDAARVALGAGVDVLVYGHDTGQATAAFDYMVKECARDPSLHARVETSYRRVRSLKRRYLRSFTAAPTDELRRRLLELGHQRLSNRIQGSLYAV
jgi:beta-N-acetylhexosaminidase